jgi:hypothetical protein
MKLHTMLASSCAAWVSVLVLVLTSAEKEPLVVVVNEGEEPLLMVLEDDFAGRIVAI